MFTIRAFVGLSKDRMADQEELPALGAGGDQSTPIKTLGATPRIGSLYNAHKGEFVHGNFFAKGDFWHPKKGDKVQTPFVTRNRDRNVKSDYFFTANADEKMNKIDVSAEIKLNILSGVAEISGSGAYLSDKRKSNKTISCTFQQHVATGYDQVNFSQHGLETFVDLRALSDDVTHVVYYVERGVDVLVDLQYEMDDDYDNMQVRAAAEANIKEIISAKGSVDVEQRSRLKNEKMRFTVFADLEPPASLAPTSIGQAMRLVEKFPSLVKKDNEGVPLTFKLISVRDVLRKFSTVTDVDQVVNQIKQREVQKVVEMFKTVEKQVAQFNDFYADMELCRRVMGEKMFQIIADFRSEVQVAESEVKRRLADALPKIRAFKGSATKSANSFGTESINVILQYFETTCLSKPNMKRFKDRFASMSDWSLYFRELQEKKVRLLHSAIEFDELSLRVQMAETPFPVFLLFFSVQDEFRGEALSDLLNEFDAVRKQNQSANSEIYAVCIDELPDLLEQEYLPPGPQIVTVRNRQFVPYIKESSAVEDVNVLLIGPTNTHKSFFVNCLDYYLNATTFEQLDKLPLSERVCTRALDRGFERISQFMTIQFPRLHCGESSANELFASRDENMTRHPRRHYYFVKDKKTGKKKRLCLIDTPGFPYWSDLHVKRELADFVDKLDQIHHVFVLPRKYPAGPTLSILLAEALNFVPKQLHDRVSLLPLAVYTLRDLNGKTDTYEKTISTTRDGVFRSVVDGYVSIHYDRSKMTIVPFELHAHTYKIHRAQGGTDFYEKGMRKTKLYTQVAEGIQKLMERVLESKPFSGKLISNLEYVRQLLPVLDEVIKSEELQERDPGYAPAMLLRAKEQLAHYVKQRSFIPVVAPSFFATVKNVKGPLLDPQLPERQFQRAKVSDQILKNVGKSLDVSDEEAHAIVDQLPFVHEYGPMLLRELRAH